MCHDEKFMCLARKALSSLNGSMISLALRIFCVHLWESSTEFLCTNNECFHAYNANSCNQKRTDPCDCDVCVAHEGVFRRMMFTSHAHTHTFNSGLFLHVSFVCVTATKKTMTETDSDIYRRLERLLPSVGMMVRRHFCILRYAFFFCYRIWHNRPHPFKSLRHRCPTKSDLCRKRCVFVKCHAFLSGQTRIREISTDNNGHVFVYEKEG